MNGPCKKLLDGPAGSGDGTPHQKLLDLGL
jgi:hypothetical protein